MSSEKKDSLPQGSGGPSGRQNGNRTINFNVSELHYTKNDLEALNDLAKTDPKLARAVVRQRDKEDERANVSYRFGIISTVCLVGLVFITMSFMFVYLGIVAATLSLLMILSIALLIRVVLTGEWSDTSWLGFGVQALARMLGSSPKDGDNKDNGTSE